MNSEELEISLRTEFENYLKNVFADMRQEISQLQTKIETEIENHKSQLNEVFKSAMGRIESGQDFDEGFKESVVEHMRLARDEGARITATAIAEAEDMDKKSAVPVAGIKELHAAVNDISSKSSQAEILKALVHHASQFAPRGAFFIIKNEHFVGWRSFGGENGNSEDAVREVFLPISSDSILSEAVRSLATVESNSETYSADSEILNKLEFGSPDKMFAIPLVARGRGVAVLYTDYGTHGGDVSVEALETMVHVAGLTVELLASARGASPKKKPVAENSEEADSTAKETVQAESGFAPSYHAPAEASESFSDNQYQSSFEDSPAGNNLSYSNENAGENFVSGSYPVENKPVENKPVENKPVENKPVENKKEEPGYQYDEPVVQAENNYPTYEDSSWNQPVEDAHTDYTTTQWNSSEAETPMISAQEYADNFVKEADSPSQNYSFEPAIEPEAPLQNDFSAGSMNDYQTGSMNDYQIGKPKAESFESFAPQPETYAPVAPEANPVETVKPSNSFAEPAAPPVTTNSTAKTRLSERNVDLPIEVSEDERRLHNDARRFARLLVSEIKLYNEQKVKEGREGSDLYDRLREAIDRSREMYDKRVQPPVAAKFDYFHYELVNTLAEGDSNKLGADYPGPAL